MRETDDDGKRIRVVEQQKTGTGVLIRKHQELAAVLAENRQRRKLAGRVHGTILQTARGQQFKERSFAERQAPYFATAIVADPELAALWERFAREYNEPIAGPNRVILEGERCKPCSTLTSCARAAGRS